MPAGRPFGRVGIEYGSGRTPCVVAVVAGEPDGEAVRVVVATGAAAAALLTSFILIERRSTHAELPLHLLRSRRRSGAYIMMLLIATALFAVFFFLTIYVQTVWGYSAVKAGLAWVPFPIMLIAINVYFFEAREVLRHYPDVDFADDPQRYSEKMLQLMLQGILPTAGEEQS